MNTRNTIVLLALFFAGLVGLWWADYSKVPTPEEVRKRADRVLPELLDTPLAKIERIEIEGGERPLAFERRAGDRWQMTSPIDVAADRPRIDALLKNLHDFSRNPDAKPLAGRLSQFGLEPPSRTVRLYAAGSKTPVAVLDVGKVVDGRNYVRAAGRKEVDTVDSMRLGPIAGAVADWRERSLINASSLDVHSVEIEGPNRRFKADRAEGSWRIRAPFDAPGDDQKIDGLVADLLMLRVADGNSGFVADDTRDLARYGLDKPSLTVRVATRAGTAAEDTAAVLIGDPVPGETDKVFARRGDQNDVVKIDGKTLANLARDPRELRGRQVTGLEPQKESFVAIEAGGTTYELSRHAEGWSVLTPDKGRADTRVVRELLAQLEALRATAVLDPAQTPATGLDRPAALIKVWQSEPVPGADTPSRPAVNPDVTLAIGRLDPRRDAVYVRTEGDASVLTVPPTVLKLVPNGRFAYRDRVVMNLLPDQIERIELKRDGREYEVESSGRPRDYNNWKLTRPVKAPVDAEAVARLDLLISRLRAESLVAERPSDLAAYGLDHPSSSVTWTTRPQPGASSKPVRQSLLIGKTVPDAPASRFAKLSDGTTVFTLSPEALAIVGNELRDHRLLTLNDEQLTKIVLRWPGRTQTWTRHQKPFEVEAEWRPEAGSEAQGIDGARVRLLVKTLSNLSAARFAQYEGPFRPEYGLKEPELTIEVHLMKGLGTRVLRLGRLDPSGARFATTETRDEGAVALLSNDPWRDWLTPPPAAEALPAEVFSRQK